MGGMVAALGISSSWFASEGPIGISTLPVFRNKLRLEHITEAHNVKISI